MPLASVEPCTGTSGWTLGPQVPQSPGTALRRLGLWWLQRMGWHFEGAMPDLPKFVCIVAPHTSNYDFFVGLAAKWALGFAPRWLGKNTLFLPPLGWFMRATGGVPVDRQNRRNMVEQSIHEFTVREQFVLVLAPEGTRRKVTEWRSGFWHVAKGAGVPICCVAFDWRTRTVRLGPTTMPIEDDPAAGIARIRSYYDDVQGYDPSLQT
ncbi:MAG: lysophospholipid acyltransferase family protein [Gemmatimonadota bacterium]